MNELIGHNVDGGVITSSLYDKINTQAVLEDGDVIALSGRAPYSWGYGAPAVCLSSYPSFTVLSRSALVTTDSEEALIAAAAIIGESNIPNSG